MTFRRGHLKLVALAVSCVALGAGISAIASAGAASAPRAGAPGARGGFAMRIFRRSAEGRLVVRTRTAWATVSFERGSVVSLSGRQLTLREGTKAAAYRTVTLTIPTGAAVRVNRRPGTLAQLTPGQRALVVTLPQRTLVVAHTPRTP